MPHPAGGLPGYERARLAVGDFDVTYLAAGAGPRTVVLLHGFGAWSEVVWSRAIPALADRYRVVAPDLLGFGLSAKPAAALIDPQDPLAPEVRFLEAFLDALAIPSAALVGSSFGGGVALRFASERPARVEKLALVASMGLGRDIHYAYKALAMPYLGDALARPNKLLLRMMWENIVHDPKLVTEEIVAENHRLMSEPGAAEVIAAARHGVNLLGQKILLDEHLARVACPTLVVWGKRDRIFPLRHAHRAMERLQRGELAVLDCGHLPPFESPRLFNRALREFLDAPTDPEAYPSGADALDGAASGA